MIQIYSFFSTGSVQKISLLPPAEDTPTGYDTYRECDLRNHIKLLYFFKLLITHELLAIYHAFFCTWCK